MPVLDPQTGRPVGQPPLQLMTTQANFQFAETPAGILCRMIAYSPGAGIAQAQEVAVEEEPGKAAAMCVMKFFRKMGGGSE
jgi:hypothetical protein